MVESVGQLPILGNRESRSACTLSTSSRNAYDNMQRTWREGESGFMLRMVTHAYCRSSGLHGKDAAEKWQRFVLRMATHAYCRSSGLRGKDAAQARETRRLCAVVQGPAACIGSGWVMLITALACIHPRPSRCWHDALAPPRQATMSLPAAGPVGVQVGEIGHAGHPGARVCRVAQAQPHERGGGFHGGGRQQRLSRGGWPGRGQCIGSQHRSSNGLQGAAASSA